MTAGEFAKKIQGYYGMAYPEGQRADIGEYLSGLSDSYLDALYKAVIRNHSAAWKALPDIAIFEKTEVKTMALDTAAELQKKIGQNLYVMAITDGMEMAKDEDVDKFFADMKKKLEEKEKALSVKSKEDAIKAEKAKAEAYAKELDARLFADWYAK